MGYLYKDTHSRYCFQYDLNYINNKTNHIHRELLIPSTKMFPLFDNLIPEGVMFDNMVKKYGTKDKVILLSKLEDNLGSFSFEDSKNLYRVFVKSNINIKSYTEALSTEFEKDFDKDIYNSIILSKINSSMSFSGNQPKISLLSENGTLSIPNKSFFANVILKVHHSEYVDLALNELMFMNFAKYELNFNTPKSYLFIDKIEKDFKLQEKINYIVERFDLDFKNGKKLECYEFAQLMGINSEDKYLNTTENLFYFAKNILSQDDLNKMFEYYYLGYLIGNADMHIKNFAVIKHNKKEYSLAPMYDMLSTVNYENIKEFQSLALNLNSTSNPSLKEIYEFAFNLDIDLNRLRRVNLTILDKLKIYIDKTSFENSKPFLDRVEAIQNHLSNHFEVEVDVVYEGNYKQIIYNFDFKRLNYCLENKIELDSLNEAYNEIFNDKEFIESELDKFEKLEYMMIEIDIFNKNIIKKIQ